MATSDGRQRLREEFDRVTNNVASDEEARLASPGVEGVKVFLDVVNEEEEIGVEQIREAYQSKEWAENSDITWADLVSLLDTLFQSTSKVEKESISEKSPSTLPDDSPNPSGGEIDSKQETAIVTETKSEKIEKASGESSMIPVYPVETHATEEEVKKRKAMLEKATVEQSRAAEAKIPEAYSKFLISVGKDKAKYFPVEPTFAFAAEYYYRILEEILDVQGSTFSSAPKRKSEKVIASPMKRTKKNRADPEELSVAELHCTAKVGGYFHFNGCLMGIEEAIRNIEVTPITTGTPAPSQVFNVVLGDQGGVIQLTIWRDKALEFHQDLTSAMEAVEGELCVKVRLTNLILRDVRYPGPKIRMLHSSEKTDLRLEGSQKLEMSPAAELFPIIDFRDLNKWSLPFMLHLRGTITGSAEEKITSKGDEQIHFSLMDTNRRTVTCIAHDVGYPKKDFEEGREIALYAVTIQEGIRNGPGSVWIYSNSYMVFLGITFLPGSPLEAVPLRGKEDGSNRRKSIA